jgi:hypothetical protein
LEAREQDLQQAQKRVANSATFLGSSLYQQERFREAAGVYLKEKPTTGNASIG